MHASALSLSSLRHALALAVLLAVAALRPVAAQHHGKWWKWPKAHGWYPGKHAAKWGHGWTWGHGQWRHDDAQSAWSGHGWGEGDTSDEGDDDCDDDCTESMKMGHHRGSQWSGRGGHGGHGGSSKKSEEGKKMSTMMVSDDDDSKDMSGGVKMEMKHGHHGSDDDDSRWWKARGWKHEGWWSKHSDSMMTKRRGQSKSGGWVPGSGMRAARCMLHQCGQELHTCRRDHTCRAAMQCVLGCGMGGDAESRGCAFQCALDNQNDATQDMFACILEKECMPAM